jgi:peptidoglycan/xylan/chitin deacetylase (PgdA/CDA1 family)
VNFNTQYKDLISHKKTLRTGVRTLALDVLGSYYQVFGSDTDLQKPRIQFIYLHHVLADEITKFDLLIQHLSKKYTFISHSQAVLKLKAGTIDKPYISISFDDGFLNNLDAAAVLDRYNVKGCFFINPFSIGLKDYAKIERYCRSKLNLGPMEFMNWKEVDTLLKHEHEIGSHTYEHVNISSMTLNEVEDDFNKTFEILKEKTGSAPHFAYPYGKFGDFNLDALTLAKKAGFLSVSSAVRGCHISDGKPVNIDNILLRRDHIIADWKIEHSLYFLRKAAQNSTIRNNFNPYK